MTRRRLGGLEVSAIGVGAPIYGEPSADAVIPGLHRALERGVDLVDTSDIYWHGVHEELVGRAIKGRRDQVVLATKGNIRPPGGTPSADGRPEHVLQACEASLRRLEVEVIDLYYIHRVDPTVPIEDTVGAMARLVAQGKVRHLGICEAALATIIRAHATHPMTALARGEYRRRPPVSGPGHARGARRPLRARGRRGGALQRRGEAPRRAVGRSDSRLALLC
jgi:aryl-alcohol dehydrogenase-like predicted oxidoreductase